MDAKSEIESSYESLLFNKEDDYRSPESSDCEGYATPLATSCCDISKMPLNQNVTIRVPDENANDEQTIDSRELTPVGQTQTRAESPPVVTQIMFLEKPKILVMTQKSVDEIVSKNDPSNLEKVEELKSEIIDRESEAENVDAEKSKKVENSEDIKTTELENEEPVIEQVTNAQFDLTKNEKVEQVEINLKADFEKVEESVMQAPKIQKPQTIGGSKTKSLVATFEELAKAAEVAPIPLQHSSKPTIVEKYPSDETEKEMDDDSDDKLQNQIDSESEIMAMQHVSQEVGQLVAAINSFEERKEGKEEEQCGKEENDEKETMVEVVVPEEEKMKEVPEVKKSDAVVCKTVNVPTQHQTVQTDDDDLILVERWVPDVMESLRLENEKLRSQLEHLKIESAENLRKETSHLQKQLDEANHTIDEIEVEAEQQYTEMTSEIDELCELVTKKDEELATLKEQISKLTVNEYHWRDDVESQKAIVQRQKEVIEGLREELEENIAKLIDMTKLRDRAAEEAIMNKMKSQDVDVFLAKEAQMSVEIEDLQRELNKQKLILGQTSMSKLADTFERKILKLENDVRERDMLICKQNQFINRGRNSPSGSNNNKKQYQSRAAALAAESGPSTGSSSESFQTGIDADSREAILGFILSDRYNQLANVYNLGRILDLTLQEERSLERHLTRDRFPEAERSKP